MLVFVISVLFEVSEVVSAVLGFWVTVVLVGRVFGLTLKFIESRKRSPVISFLVSGDRVRPWVDVSKDIVTVGATVVVVSR